MANTDYTYDGIMNGTGYFKNDNSATKSMSVKRMQMKLSRLGYSIVGTPDGYFGNNTEKAVLQFQGDYDDLEVDGFAGPATLTKLNQLSPDSTSEKYGRELTHTELRNGYSDSSISQTEALARCIYGEDTLYSAGQSAVAKEIYNRKNSVRNFLSSGKGNTWKGVVYSENQYAVLTSSSTSSTQNARAPELYSDEWANCVTLATNLVNGKTPTSTLGKQCYHVAATASYPSSAVASTKIQIPASKGNKFYDTKENPD